MKDEERKRTRSSSSRKSQSKEREDSQKRRKKKQPQNPLTVPFYMNHDMTVIMEASVEHTEVLHVSSE